MFTISFPARIAPGVFSREYRRLVADISAVREKAKAPGDARVTEKVVRCLWFDEYFDTAALRTEDGRGLALYSPGVWNEGAGPDFRNAEFAFDGGERLRGDVELHVHASAWNQHGHADDPAYRNVRLHVVLYNDLDAPTVSHRQRAIPQLALSRHLTADLAEIMESLAPQTLPEKGVGREGPCCRSARALGRDERWLAKFLDIAGDERMLTKARFFKTAMNDATPDEVIYAAIMECMGYSANRHGFRALARAASLRELRKWTPLDDTPEETARVIEAILFGVAGFLNSIKPSHSADPETADYLRALRKRWRPVARNFPAPLDPSAWVLNRTRPTNHPVRRIPAVAALLARHLHSGLCRAILAAVESVPSGGNESRRCRQTVEKLCDLFQQPAGGYWLRRTTFGPPTLKRPNRLIGPTRATEIVVNAVIPTLLALSERDKRPRAEHRLHNIYSALKPLADNAVTRYMKRRMFAGAAAAKRVVSSVRRQQGLIQIFHDFCESADTTCESCGFLAAVEGRAE